MKVALFGKSISESTLPNVQQLIDALCSFGSEIFVYHLLYKKMEGQIIFSRMPQLFANQSDIENRVDFLLSIGGDGTILDAVGIVGNSGIPIAGINIGRLGFLSVISRDMINPALLAIRNGDFLLEQRSLLLLEKPDGLFGTANYALNDITVFKPDVTSILAIRTWINDLFLNSYWADGLIISTPTGSTAYSLSCNGPIMTPDAQNFLITPIASHNLTVRPVVVRDDSTIRITVASKTGSFLASLDSRVATAGEETELIIRKAPFAINLLKMKDKNFFQTIREKLNWGLDNRN